MNKRILYIVIISLFLFFILFILFPSFFGSVVSYPPNLSESVSVVNTTMVDDEVEKPIPPLDTVLYDQKLLELANNPPDKIVYETVTTVEKDENGKSITKTSKVPLDPQPVVTHPWPVKTAYPLAGAILPFNRIVAYYGNLYSKNMGVLGEYPEAEMLAKLNTEVKKWEEADPSTPVIPALHYIVVVAQASPGESGKYRLSDARNRNK